MNEQIHVDLLRKKVNSSFTGLKFEDSFLIKFLRAREYDVNTTYCLLNRYLHFRRSHPDLFKPPSQVRNVFEDNICCVLPRRNTNGSAIVLVRPGNWQPEKYDVNHVMSAAVSLHEQAVLDQETQKHGIESIIDMRNTSMKHLLSITVNDVRVAADLTEHCLPVKFEKIHVVNHNRVADVVYTLAAPFLSPEMKRRIIFHHSTQQLHNYVTPSALPAGRRRQMLFPHLQHN